MKRMNDKIRKILTSALAVMFALGFMAATGLASSTAYAADEYTYTIKVYSGKEGWFGDSDTAANHVRSVTVSYGDTVKIASNDGIYVNGEKKADLKLTLADSAKYDVRGFTEAGHDNTEVIISKTWSSWIDGDMSFSTVYGMEGGMVKYTVNYLDGSGNALAPAATYYGMAGDYPVVSFTYVEGYQPDAYNKGKTLSENEADNVFNFYYSAADTETTVNTVTVNGGTNANGAAGAGAGGAGADGTTIADGETPAAGPEEFVDLDDGQTPTTDGSELDGTDIDDGKTPGTNWAAIGGGAVIVAAIAAALVIFAKRRKREEE